MAWTAPMTAIANSVFTAAQFNTHVRDNLNETAVAKATAGSRIIVTGGANIVVERAVTRDLIATSQTTASTTYTDLTTVGPTVGPVACGANAMAFWTALANNTTADARTYMSVEVSGTTSYAADDTRTLIQSAAASINVKAGGFNYFPLSAGDHTFTAKYRVSAGTGAFADRQLFVIPL